MKIGKILVILLTRMEIVRMEVDELIDFVKKKMVTKQK